jgi:hypothetical protein
MTTLTRGLSDPRNGCSFDGAGPPFRVSVTAGWTNSSFSRNFSPLVLRRKSAAPRRLPPAAETSERPPLPISTPAAGAVSTRARYGLLPAGLVASVADNAHAGAAGQLPTQPVLPGTAPKTRRRPKRTWDGAEDAPAAEADLVGIGDHGRVARHATILWKTASRTSRKFRRTSESFTRPDQLYRTW